LATGNACADMAARVVLVTHPVRGVRRHLARPAAETGA
jgi:hypothetical protein